MATSRTVRDEITNLLDYLLNSELALYVNVVSIGNVRVSWHVHQPWTPFLMNYDHPTLDTYKRWVEAGAYSAILFDGALLQITYDVEGGRISGHRLAYVPCPYDVDKTMLREEPLLDVLDLHVEMEPTKMMPRSTVRFDFAPRLAKPGHPAAHMTINSSTCRIACMVPMHVGRFAHFVFKNFYPDLWLAHVPYFNESAQREIGKRVITEDDSRHPHLAWR
jgi:hypothetical protein